MDIRLQLQIKKDPANYTSLYMNELEKMRGMMKISKLDPQAKNQELCSLLTFLPHISKNYSEDISNDIFNYALDYYNLLERSLSQAVITSIIILKKTKQIGPDVFYKNAIILIEEMDKRTKTVFIQFLISEIIRDKEHKELIQNVLVDTIESRIEAHSKRAVYIFIHLISRDVWKDQNTTELLFKIILKSSSVVINFIFMYLLDRVRLTITEEEIEIQANNKTNQKIKRETRADKKKKERQTKALNKKLEEKKEKQNSDPNIIKLLNRLGEKGPFYASKLFKLIKASEHKMEIKLMMAQIVSRIISHYKINIKGFLGYMMRFLFPHQDKLPSVFAAIAQSIHEGTEEKEVEAVCDLIVENFCSDYKDDDIIAYGINSIRAIVKRYPGAVEYDCIKRIMDYRKMKKRRAVVASTSLKKMIREINRQKEGEFMESEDEDVDESNDESGSDVFLSGEEDSYVEESESESEGDDESILSSTDNPHGFVTEEMIGKIRTKSTREEKMATSKAEKRQKKKREHTGTNKEKQKTTNYTVRRTKRVSIPKKITKKRKR
ncbi:protein SDA1 [Nematocida parisii]|uniref:Protein SDA1 n=1 Tax=Nematocida parisii (strain ERTm3) TaxID=935791 RepID=I3EE13_NEMP3|nr:uncharacterized protein NEPG_00062 [Nematocida parisii ERTm1]EIJ87460.1 hypothetical protein NEQG_02341 [Nematocida parisii ERTm3]KAI5127087.1 protein SDA1 [Nematocida parisii]EIJ94540.1 hypothetical protein NEPG_00062 [Nematocida parisii ERTm1]KAI5127634.1 protein SDA1 [Nematocida parisii]KAI5141187.1 protein SDA1 [Nematocida parisii]|eukprot:XP_013057896.1 hypothetical protein NEPG_00062 [Nematocida parisii ERTm1]